MYENDYEEYMRSVLGYPNNNNTYHQPTSFPYRNTINEINYDDLYPDIYKILKPMIKKICDNPKYRSITNETLEAMTTEIYNNIESDINLVNINITTSPNSSELTREAEKSKNINNNTRNTVNANKVSSSSNKEETRQCCGNPTLRDLIKILILNQLLNNNANRPPRPPVPPRPPIMPYPPFRDTSYNYRELENPAYYGNF